MLFVTMLFFTDVTVAATVVGVSASSAEEP